MKRDEMRELADAFVPFQLAPDAPEATGQSDRPAAQLRSVDVDPPKAPGAWLLDTLGLALTAVGLNFRSGPATRRYLAVIDSRSVSDMRSWPAQYARSWLRRNRSRLSDSTEVESLIAPDRPWRPYVWRQILDRPDLTFTFWGPDQMPTTPKLERAMSLFILGRTVEMDLGSRAAFSCLLAASPQLGRASIIRHIGANGARGMDDAAQAVDAYLGSR